MPRLAATLTSAALSVVAVVRRQVEIVRNWREARRGYAALCEMDERTLSDLGLTRSDLRDATAVSTGRDPVTLLSLRRNERREPRTILREVEAPSIANEALGARHPARPSVQPC